MTPVPETLSLYLTFIFERKPRSVTAMDVSRLTSYTDVLIIIEAGSGRQVTTLADHIMTRLADQGIRPLGTEGLTAGEWVLLDYGDVVIHIFESRALTFFDLAGLWSDAPRFNLTPYLPDFGNKEVPHGVS